MVITEAAGKMQRCHI